MLPMERLLKLYLRIFAVILSIGANAAPSAIAAEPTVLTITGEMANPNRGALDPFHDAFLKHKDKAFTKAYAFTRTALAALPQTKIVTHVEGWPAKVELEGPLLSDALTAAGVAADATIVATALDGYNVDLSPQTRAENKWVLAITANGAPLAIGGRGPVWLLHGTDGKAVSQDIEATWVWALYLLEAQ